MWRASCEEGAEGLGRWRRRRRESRELKDVGGGKKKVSVGGKQDGKRNKREMEGGRES